MPLYSASKHAQLSTLCHEIRISLSLRLSELQILHKVQLRVHILLPKYDVVKLGFTLVDLTNRDRASAVCFLDGTSCTMSVVGLQPQQPALTTRG